MNTPITDASSSNVQNVNDFGCRAAPVDVSVQADRDQERRRRPAMNRLMPSMPSVHDFASVNSSTEWFETNLISAYSSASNWISMYTARPNTAGSVTIPAPGSSRAGAAGSSKATADPRRYDDHRGEQREPQLDALLRTSAVITASPSS